MTEELDAAAVALERVRRDALSVLVACSVYIDWRADEGDPEAQMLKGYVDRAFTGMRAETIAAASLVHERLNARR